MPVSVWKCWLFSHSFSKLRDHWKEDATQNQSFQFMSIPYITDYFFRKKIVLFSRHFTKTTWIHWRKFEFADLFDFTRTLLNLIFKIFSDNRDHSITTWTRWGGEGVKKVCFCPRSGWQMAKICPRSCWMPPWLKLLKLCAFWKNQTFLCYHLLINTIDHYDHIINGRLQMVLSKNRR